MIRGMTDQATSSFSEPSIPRGSSVSERRRYLIAKTITSSAISKEKKALTASR